MHHTGTKVTSVTEDDPRWLAILSRDLNADGKFYYSVKTTGIYCRPSCPARKAKPENVNFHASPAEAEAAGFRPCRRCKPNQPSLQEQYAAKVPQICRLIESAEAEPNLAELAKQTELSVYHFLASSKPLLGSLPQSMLLRIGPIVCVASWNTVRLLPRPFTMPVTIPAIASTNEPGRCWA